MLEESLREVRLALLEADVHVGVVKALLDAVREKALGEEVLQSLTPGQQVVKIVRDELAAPARRGRVDARLRFASRPPTVVLLVGLQGSGKTTTTAKLGALAEEAGRYPVSSFPADVYRPAAIEQLVRVGAVGGPAGATSTTAAATPLEIARAGAGARRGGPGFDTRARRHRRPPAHRRRS